MLTLRAFAMNSLKEAKLNFAKCVQAVLALSASIFTAFAFLKTPMLNHSVYIFRLVLM